MRDGHASRTAGHMAFFRALETARAPGERVCDDPLATAFLGPSLRLVAALARWPPAGALVRDYVDRRWPGARTSAVARTRFIDDVAVGAIAAGCEQVVILGAGFDARAYRLAAMSRTTVFEVDHPSTSAAKRSAVEAALGALPGHVRFVAIDFDTMRLPDAMDAAGFEPARRTIVVWEGVTNYLTEAAVDATLRWCAGLAAGSRVVFTYVDRRVIDVPAEFHGTAKLFATLAAADERWTFGLAPLRVPAFLAERGLVLDEDVGATDYRRRCLGEAAARVRGYEFYHVAVAHVAEGP